MQDRETEVRLKDLLAYCFLHWRSALAIALCGALLGSGYTLYKARRSAAAATATAQAAASEEQADSISAINAAQKDAIVSQYDNLAERMTYYNDSLYMKINPSDEHVSRANIVISVAGSWNSDVLKKVYAAYANEMWSGDAVKRVAEQMGTTQAYLRELVSFSTVNAESSDSGTASIVLEQPEDTTNSSSMVLALQVVAPTEEDATMLLEALLEDMGALTGALSSSIGAHDFVVTSKTTYTAVDYALLDKQTTVANSISTNKQQITTNEKNFKASSQSSSVAGSAKTSVSKKALAKRGILGGAAAFLFYGFILCLRYLLGGKPEVKCQVASRYGLPDLGSYKDGCQKYYRHGFVFDRWLRKILGMADPADESSVETMIAANVKLYAGDAKNVLVSSSASSDRAAKLTERLASLLPDRTFSCANALMSDAASRERLEDVDAVLLVEEYGNSEFAAIDGALELLADAGKKTLGLVMA